MSAKKTQEQFEQEIKELHPHITVVGKYTTARNPITVRCDIHNYEYSVVAGALLGSVYGCKFCAREHWGLKRRQFSINGGFKQTVEKTNPNVIVLGEYTYAKSRVKVRCAICGNEWNAIADSLLRGYGCKKCAMKYVQNLNTKTHDEFLVDFREKNPNHDKIKFITTYEKFELPITCECSECGNVWVTTPHNLCDGSGCPVCRLSKGEGKIREFLINNNIKYESQKMFDGLLGCGGKNLRYDFYLPEHNALIEYQGEFHDNSVLFQTKNEFEKLKIHDKKKKNYAVENGYNFIEIWYKDFNNISSILQNKLLGDKSNGQQC